MLSPIACGASGSAVAVPSRAAISVAVKAGTLDASALSAGGFDALLFGVMISSSDNHDGCQCCSGPKPMNTGLPQGLTEMKNNVRIMDGRSERAIFNDPVHLPFTLPSGAIYTRP